MKMISNIVFTKNRPLQLDGYLESLYRYLPAEQIQTHILWKQELFTQEYEQLFSRYPNCTIAREADFSIDFLDILKRIDTPYILFGIDDVVFFDSVSFGLIDETFNKADDIFGFSLRFGNNVLESDKENIETAGQNISRIKWPKGKTRTSRYPFELCATVYRTELVKKIINESRSSNHLAAKLFSPNSLIIKWLRTIGLARKTLKRFGFFYTPNTLESWVCRWCQENAEVLPPYLYFQKACAAAVQVNTVNTSTKSAVGAINEYTVEALNEKYQQGCRLDIDFIAKNKPKHTHCDKESFKLVREIFK